MNNNLKKKKKVATAFLHPFHFVALVCIWMEVRALPPGIKRVVQNITCA